MDVILLQSGAKAGNVNADFVVPDGQKGYRVLYGQTILVTNGTAANRQLSFGIYDDAGVLVFDTHAGVTVPASQTAHFELMQGIYRESAITAGSIQVPIPSMCEVRPGWTIRVAIGAGVAGDSHATKLVVRAID